MNLLLQTALQTGRVSKELVLGVVKEMTHLGVKPNLTTFFRVLQIFSKLGMGVLHSTPDGVPPIHLQYTYVHVRTYCKLWLLSALSAYSFLVTRSYYIHVSTRAQLQK